MFNRLIDGQVGRFVAQFAAQKLVDFMKDSTVLQETSDCIAYEVIRLRHGVPLFWENHVERMQKTAAKVSLPLPTSDELWQVAQLLYKADPREQANLRLVLTNEHLWAHYSRVYYPSEEQRDSGVPTAVIDWERVDPQVKLIRPDYKAAVAEKLGKSGPHGNYFEVLLKNRAGALTEGSRSNLFFVLGNTVYSAPDAEILLGITRKYVLQAIDRLGLHLKTDLPSWETLRWQGAGAFLSASPIDVLPISYIEDVKLPHPSQTCVAALSSMYQEILDELTMGKPRFKDI